jgi:hypothetical protein
MWQTRLLFTPRGGRWWATRLPLIDARVRAGRIEQAGYGKKERSRQRRRRRPGTTKDERGKKYLQTHGPSTQPIIDMAPTYTRSSISWVPTVACGVLQDSSERPNALQLLVADFDWFAPRSACRRQLASLDEGEPLTDVHG